MQAAVIAKLKGESKYQKYLDSSNSDKTNQNSRRTSQKDQDYQQVALIVENFEIPSSQRYLNQAKQMFNMVSTNNVTHFNNCIPCECIGELDFNSENNNCFEFSLQQNYGVESKHHQILSALQDKDNIKQNYSQRRNKQGYQQGSYCIIANQFNITNQANIKEIEQYVKALQSSNFAKANSYITPSITNKLRFILQNWSYFSPTHQQSFKDLLVSIHKNILILPDFAEIKQQKQIIYNALNSVILKFTKQAEKKIEFKAEQEVANQSNQQPEQQAKKKKNLLANQTFKFSIKEFCARANKLGSCYVETKNNIEDDRSTTSTANTRPSQSGGSTNGTSQNAPPLRSPPPPPTNKVAIAEYIPSKSIFNDDIDEWRDALFTATAVCKYNKAVTQHNDMKKNIESIYEFSELLLNNHELAQPSNRLCCARFFYSGFNICPLPNLNLIIHDKLFEFTKSESNHHGKNKTEIKEANPSDIEDILKDICSLLNGGGGVILFNCKQEYLEIRPFGEQILETKKVSYKKIIQKCIKNIHPKVQLGKQVNLSFVPVAKNPYEANYNKTRNKDRQFLQGQYVMRIAVMPNNQERLHFIAPNKNNNEAISAIFTNGNKKIIKGTEIYQQMKRRIEFCGVFEDDEDSKYLVEKQCIYLGKHTCPEPERGWSKMSDGEPDQSNKSNKYRNVSLLIASDKHWSDIEKRLKNRGYDCWINTTFKKYQLKPIKNCVPIHYDSRFDQLVNEMCYKQEFKFDQRYATILAATYWVKLKPNAYGRYFQNLPNKYNAIKSIMQDDFPQYSLQHWEHRIDQRSVEHYMKTSSPLTTLFLFFILYHHNQQCVLKNPFPLNATPQDQEKILNKMNKIYPGPQDSKPLHYNQGGGGQN